MKKIVRLTETDLTRIVKQVIEEQLIAPKSPFDSKEPLKYDKPRMAGYEKIKGAKTIDRVIPGISGEDLFPMGKADVNKNNEQLKSLITKCKTDPNVSCMGLTVDGYASKTKYAGNAADSPIAMKLNKDLAAKRRDNVVAYLKSQGVPAIAGKAEVINQEDGRKVTFRSDKYTIPGKQQDYYNWVERDNTAVTFPLRGGCKKKIIEVQACDSDVANFKSKLKMYNWFTSRGYKIVKVRDAYTPPKSYGIGGIEIK